MASQAAMRALRRRPNRYDDEDTDPRVLLVLFGLLVAGALPFAFYCIYKSIRNKRAARKSKAEKMKKKRTIYGEPIEDRLEAEGETSVTPTGGNGVGVLFSSENPAVVVVPPAPPTAPTPVYAPY